MPRPATPPQGIAASAATSPHSYHASDARRSCSESQGNRLLRPNIRTPRYTVAAGQSTHTFTRCAGTLRQHQRAIASHIPVHSITRRWDSHDGHTTMPGGSSCHKVACVALQPTSPQPPRITTLSSTPHRGGRRSSGEPLLHRWDVPCQTYAQHHRHHTPVTPTSKSGPTTRFIPNRSRESFTAGALSLSAARRRARALGPPRHRLAGSQRAGAHAATHGRTHAH